MSADILHDPLPRLAANAPALALVASLAVLGGAFFFQYVVGLAPCELCLLQRWPYVAAIVISAALIILSPSGDLRRAGVALCGVAFLATAAIGAYHVGVEQGWIAGPAACTGRGITATTVEDLERQLMATPVVRCDEVQWSLFGISLAGFNVLIAGALGVACLAASRVRLDRTA